MASVKVHWYGQACLAVCKKKFMERIYACCVALRDYIRIKLSVPNSKVEIKQKTVIHGKEIQLKTTRKVTERGDHPSAPGDYPRKVRGWLRRNVQMEVSYEEGKGRVGTNVPYGRWLELGTRRMKRRPWLSRGLAEMQAVLKSIMERAGGSNDSGT